MKYFHLLIYLLISFYGTAQPGFNLILDTGYPQNHFRDMIVDNDTIIGIGIGFSDTVEWKQGIVVAKIDSSGSIIQSSIILDSLGDKLAIDKHWGKIVKSNQGGYAFTCASVNRKSAFLVKLDNDLNLEFIKEYNDTINLANYNYKLVETLGGYLIYGSVQKPDGYGDAFIRRVDQFGNTMWASYFGQEDLWENMVDVIKLSDSMYVAASVDGVTEESSRSTIRIIDIDGNVSQTWSSAPEPDIGYLRKIFPLDNGDYLTFGLQFVEKINQFTTLVIPAIARLNHEFQTKWFYNIGFVTPLGAQETFWDIEPTTDGHFIGAGESYIELPNDPDLPTGWLMKFTEYGDSLWSRYDMAPVPEHYTNNHFFGGVGVLSSGNIVAGGSFTEFNETHIWLVKVTTDGCMDTILCEPVTGIVEKTQQKASAEMKLYPNPATENVTVELPPGTGTVEILIHNLQGGLVLREIFNGGVQQLSVDVSGLTVGVYFLSARGGGALPAPIKLLVVR